MPYPRTRMFVWICAGVIALPTVVCGVAGFPEISKRVVVFLVAICFVWFAWSYSAWRTDDPLAKQLLSTRVITAVSIGTMFYTKSIMPGVVGALTLLGWLHWLYLKEGKVRVQDILW